jgi:transcriptional regulator with XRE-family HTH domain
MEQSTNPLGSFLKERRARLDPAAFGLPTTRRRTPGLRREEVAQLAHVSATWYTWLEQGRGGAPSADVLERLSRAFALTPAEREHLFLLAQDRPPKAQRPEPAAISAQLQHVLEAFADTPAIIKTAEWTVVAWNRAASAVLVDYGKLPPDRRNILRMMFLDKKHDHLPDWKAVARLVISTVRRDVMLAGANADTQALLAELEAQSEEFRQMWAEQEVRPYGEGHKTIIHPEAGALVLEYSTFAVDGRPDLALVVFNPASEADRGKVRQLIAAAGARK